MPWSLECTDVSSFIDAKGWGCAAWCGYDCSDDGTYTAAELTAVQTNCPLSCNLCAGGQNAKGMAECTTNPANTVTVNSTVNTGTSVQYKPVLVFAGVVSVLAISFV